MAEAKLRPADLVVVKKEFTKKGDARLTVSGDGTEAKSRMGIMLSLPRVVVVDSPINSDWKRFEKRANG